MTSAAVGIWRAFYGLAVGVIFVIGAILLFVVTLVRAVARPLGVLLAALIAALGLLAAVFEIDGDHGTLSLVHLAALIHLTVLRHQVGVYLHHLDTQTGPTAASIAAGAAAVVVALLLLWAVFVRPRGFRVKLSDDERGALFARRRAVGKAAAALALGPEHVAVARARVRPRRGQRLGGTIRIRATRVHASDRSAVEEEVTRELRPLTDHGGLAARVHARKTTPGPDVH